MSSSGWGAPFHWRRTGGVTGGPDVAPRPTGGLLRSVRTANSQTWQVVLCTYSPELRASTSPQNMGGKGPGCPRHAFWRVGLTGFA